MQPTCGCDILLPALLRQIFGALPDVEMPRRQISDYVTSLPRVPRSPAASGPGVRSSMVGNRSSDTKPELTMREALDTAGLTGFVVHPDLPGTPDIVFEAAKVAVFVHGCYWHRCPHCSLRIPQRNQEYWVAKFARTQARDKLNARALRAEGWTVVVVWECKLYKNPQRQMSRIRRWLSQGPPR